MDMGTSPTAADQIATLERSLLVAPPHAGKQPVRRSLAERMWACSTPGVSIAVIADGDVEWARGFGVRVRGGPAPVTPETLFQACSISKPVAAVAALRLVEQGVLDLDEDVNRYLATWQIPRNGSWQPRVSLRHLLSHTAGFTVHGFPGYRRDEPVPSLEQVLAGVPPANNLPIQIDVLPGTRYRYAGGGYCVLQRLLTDVTAQPFPALMRELILDPAGMTNSTYEQPLPPSLWDSAAAGHRVDGQPLDDLWHVYPEQAAAGLWTTPIDLARLAIQLQRGLTGQSNALLSPSTIAAMLSSQLGDQPADGEDYIGLGMFIHGTGASARFGHTGSNEGFKCELVAYREGGVGAVVMTNGDEGWTLRGEILQTLAELYGWVGYLPDAPATDIPLDGRSLEIYAGEYGLRPGYSLAIAVEADRLLLRATGQPPLTLRRAGTHMFDVEGMRARLTFTIEADAATTLLLRQDGVEQHAERLA